MSFEPVFYFRNYTDQNHEPGYILMSPYSSCPAPEGYQREYADDLPSVRRLEKQLQSQEARINEQEWMKDRSMREAGQQAVRDRLYARMVSSSTDAYEKEFIRLYLRLRDEKADKYERLYQQRTAYLHALHFDTPKGRGVDEEKVSIDRLNVRMNS